jgi:hypothetical protein
MIEAKNVIVPPVKLANGPVEGRRVIVGLVWPTLRVWLR